MQELKGRSAVVTGGSRGIGRAIVARLAGAGMAVTTCGRGPRPDDLAESVGWRQGDVADSAFAASLIAGAVRESGPLSLLVNNAGQQVEKTVTDSRDADWDAVVGTNCRGVFNMCRAALPELTRQGGSVVNIGSISGDCADRSMALYCASKAFVHGLTRAIAVDHGPQVRCNAIRPGWIATAMADDAFALARDEGEARRDALARHAAGRFGRPADIADAVVWLASDAAGFVTGQCITVDGGLTAASPLQPGLF